MDSDPIITVDDVIRAGACYDGVMRIVAKAPSRFAAAMPVSAVLKLVPEEDAHYVLSAGALNGYGYGNGDGYGNGYGDGNGYGYGNGDGNGYGYGDGGYQA